MNILIVARVDHTGAGHALMKAINEHTEHEARAVSFKRSWLQYPYDVLMPPHDQFTYLIEWADVLNLHDEAEGLLPGYAPKRPVVTTYHGSWYRGQWEKINRRDRQKGYVATCLTIDLSLFGPRWIGRAQPDLRHLRKKRAGFTVVHSPTQRHRKGTSAVVAALEGLDGMTLDIIEKVPHAECLERKRYGDVLIDQVGPRALGYGTNALEAWAMAMPVISSAPREVLNAYGSVPFLLVRTTAGIREAVLRLKNDTAVRTYYVNLGQKHLARWHSPEVVASEFVKVCEGA